jgi:DNA repair exonuclease SbcCD ATPase subunit
MKLTNCVVENFGSYKHLEFDFSKLGLALVYGKTGSGKSMLADIACWILFGVTAKNGAADEVRSWQSPDQPTKGVLNVQLSEGRLEITRIRGKSGQNDLWWTEGPLHEKKERGKDLSETQRRLCERLGVDATLYLSASYFCDFSPSGQFFVSKAPVRRELFEKIASLELPIKLGERTSEARKSAKKELEKLELDLAKLKGRLEQSLASQIDTGASYQEWAAKRGIIEEKLKKDLATAKKDAAGIPALEAKIKFIQEELKEIKAMEPGLAAARKDQSVILINLKSAQKELTRLQEVGNEACPTCLSPQADNKHRQARIVELNKSITKSQKLSAEAEIKVERFQAAMEKESTLSPDLRRVERDKEDKLKKLAQAHKELDSLDQENPFAAVAEKLAKEIALLCKDRKSTEDEASRLQQKLARLNRLYDMSFELRGELLKKAVNQIETSTNDYLEKYFDAEIRVTFSLEDADNLEVTIQKSGFECSFKQLSKGQRQLLKLCFSVSIMKASANTAGVHFDNLFFDEALDGLDDDLKVKAFGLFSELEKEHESVILIDHAPAFQSLFSKKYHVTMESDLSEIHEES